MRVVHMDSGLGNQMLDYAEFMAIKKMNPDGQCVLETLIYDLPDAPGMFSKWNGYELNKIFHIEVPNLKDQFDETTWKRIVDRVAESRFWEDNWNFAIPIVQAFAEEGLILENLQPDRSLQYTGNGLKRQLRSKVTDFFYTAPGNFVKRNGRRILEKQLVKRGNESYDVFRQYPDNSYIGHSFAFKYKGFGIEKMDTEIRTAFSFPPIEDVRNMEVLRMIQKTESVSIHARRSDLLFLNGYCYQFGYFKRAIRYIKKHTRNPVFFFFTDENSVGWCEENETIFGLDFSKDEVHFINWNKGKTSYRDMQLMAQCKHNVITESTFGFWGSYLNQNPNKITCAPDPTILTTNSF